MKTLIITDSYDATTDILIKYIGSQNVFRLNYDKYENTIISITSDGIKLIINNNEITDKDISKVLWRKPFNIDLEIDKYIDAELKYIYREIYNYFSTQNKTILVIPNIERYLGKIVQMSIAKKYFNINVWKMFERVGLVDEETKTGFFSRNKNKNKIKILNEYFGFDVTRKTSKGGYYYEYKTYKQKYLDLKNMVSN